ncbi:MAG: ACT domain-containing protein [Chloroflexota bacterium]
MGQTVDEALRDAVLTSDDYEYRFVTLPTNGITAAAGVVAQAGNPFTALLLDDKEITLMIEDEDFEQFKKRLLDHEVSKVRYRLITFDIELEPTLVGFMGRVATVLAEAGISVMPFAAFKRDHIFVAVNDYETAMRVLRDLQASVS